MCNICFVWFRVYFIRYTISYTAFSFILFPGILLWKRDSNSSNLQSSKYNLHINQYEKRGSGWLVRFGCGRKTARACWILSTNDMSPSAVWHCTLERNYSSKSNTRNGQWHALDGKILETQSLIERSKHRSTRTKVATLANTSLVVSPTRPTDAVASDSLLLRQDDRNNDGGQHQQHWTDRRGGRIVDRTVRTLWAAAHFADVQQIRRNGVDDRLVEAFCWCGH